MSSQLETVAAWPVGAPKDSALQRAYITKRGILVFADTEDTQNFDVVDPADGTLPLYIQWKGILFQYDSTDTTTPHDGETCAVTDDGKRYKAVAAIPAPYSVLSTSTTAQPASPTLHDTYYVPTAATGADWAGKDGQVGIYTARGWAFQALRIGQFVYDESSDTYYHKIVAGTLTAGFGAQALNDGAILPSNVSGGGGKIRWYVENQTTNTPPVSPTANVEYIIGSSPTGAWAAKAAQIARYENSAWTYYSPVAGWKAYDKALAIDIQFNGTAWLSAAGAVLFANYFKTDGGSQTDGGSGTYAYANGIAPTSGLSSSLDNTTAPLTANGSKCRVTWSGSFVGSAYAEYALALFVDNNSAAIDWRRASTDGEGFIHITAAFVYFPADRLLHTLKVRVVAPSDSAFVNLQRRILWVEDIA